MSVFLRDTVQRNQPQLPSPNAHLMGEYSPDIPCIWQYHEDIRQHHEESQQQEADRLTPEMARPSLNSNYSTTNGNDNRTVPRSFSTNDNEHRYLRKRCGMLLAAFNAQQLTVTFKERTEV